MLTSLALTCILAGAIGNLVDRIQHGYVIDFLDFHWRNAFHLPSFNLADLSIITGVVLVFYYTLRRDKEPQGL